MFPNFMRNPRIWIAIAVVTAIVLLRLSGFGELISLETLRTNRGALVAWVDANSFLASIAYVLVYICVVAFSVPGAVFLTLSGGFLFGAFTGTTLTSIGATVGATVVFLFAQTLFGRGAIDRLKVQYPNLIDGISKNAWSYLLVLRFVPIFPFFLVNLIAALVGVRLSTYVVTTFIGILPGTAVFSLAGAGLGSVLDQGHAFSVSSVMTPSVISALIGLAALSLAAIPIRKRLQKQNLIEQPKADAEPIAGSSRHGRD